MTLDDMVTDALAWARTEYPDATDMGALRLVAAIMAAGHGDGPPPTPTT